MRCTGAMCHWQQARQCDVRGHPTWSANKTRSAQKPCKAWVYSCPCGRRGGGVGGGGHMGAGHRRQQPGRWRRRAPARPHRRLAAPGRILHRAAFSCAPRGQARRARHEPLPHLRAAEPVGYAVACACGTGEDACVAVPVSNGPRWVWSTRRFAFTLGCAIFSNSYPSSYVVICTAEIQSYAVVIFLSGSLYLIWLFL